MSKPGLRLTADYGASPLRTFDGDIPIQDLPLSRRRAPAATASGDQKSTCEMPNSVSTASRSTSGSHSTVEGPWCESSSGPTPR